MRRVYGIWFVRQIAPALFLQIPLFVFITLREISREFFVAEIMHNTTLAMRNDTSTAGTLWLLFSNGLRDAATVPLLIITASAIVVTLLTFKVLSNLRAIFRNTAPYLPQQHGLIR